MGMFDSFYFKNGVLPNNKVPEDHEFQTKSLDCNLDVYRVDESGYVIKSHTLDGKEHIISDPINCEAEVYSHEFIYDNEKDLFNRKYLGTKYQEYKIIILNNKIQYVEKISESGYDVDKSDE